MASRIARTTAAGNSLRRCRSPPQASSRWLVDPEEGVQQVAVAAVDRDAVEAHLDRVAGGARTRR